jgi:hypothetical protein
VVSMPQAVTLAKDRGIRIFVLDPGIGDQKLASDHDQLKLVATQTDGEYYTLDDSNAIGALVGRISEQQVEPLVGVSQPAINDQPTVFLIVAIVLITLAMGMLWRLEL